MGREEKKRSREKRSCSFVWQVQGAGGVGLGETSVQSSDQSITKYLEEYHLETTAEPPECIPPRLFRVCSLKYAYPVLRSYERAISRSPRISAPAPCSSVHVLQNADSRLVVPREQRTNQRLNSKALWEAETRSPLASSLICLASNMTL
jgi:hypothetical protein